MSCLINQIEITLFKVGKMANENNNKTIPSRKTSPRRTIRSELLVVLVCVSLIPVVIVNLYYYNTMSAFMGSEVRSYNDEITRQVGQKLDSLASLINISKVQTADYLITSEDLVGYPDNSPIERVTMVKGIENFLTRLQYSFSAISYIYLFLSEDQIFTINPNCNKAVLADKYWVKSAKRHEFWDTVIPTHTADYYNIYKPELAVPVVSFVKKITWYGQGEMIGIIQIDLKYSEIKEIIESVGIGDKSFFLILDENGSIIYSPDEEFLGQSVSQVRYNNIDFSTYDTQSESIQLQDTFIVSYPLSNVNWKVVGFISTEELSQKLNEVTKISLLIMVVMLFLSVAAATLISRRITNPITKIIQKMKTVGEGKFDAHLYEAKNADLQSLTDSFNSMVNQIDSLMKGLVAKEQEKTRLELTALQAQINPHFLYNTLNSIKWMAVMEKPYPALTHAIMSLGKILKYSYENSESLVMIKDELDFLGSYIYIQKMRYGENIRVKLNIDEILYDHYILKFTLQPIIENAIIHGLAGKKGEGSIEINSYIEGQKCRFEIKDDGIGIKKDSEGKFTGLGINNIRTRIELNYGSEYGLGIDSELSKGTTVSIVLPLIGKGGEKQKCMNC